VGVGFVVRMGDRFVWRCQEEGIESWEDFAIDLLGRKKKGCKQEKRHHLEVDWTYMVSPQPTMRPQLWLAERQERMSYTQILKLWYRHTC
jgi:hypothetical protein